MMMVGQEMAETTIRRAKFIFTLKTERRLSNLTFVTQGTRTQVCSKSFQFFIPQDGIKQMFCSAKLHFGHFSRRQFWCWRWRPKVKTYLMKIRIFDWSTTTTKAKVAESSSLSLLFYHSSSDFEWMKILLFFRWRMTGSKSWVGPRKTKGKMGQRVFCSQTTKIRLSTNLHIYYSTCLVASLWSLIPG